MIRLEPLGKKQFLLSADEPVRVEVTEVDGRLIALVYRGTETATDQEPLGCFDSSQENMQWQADVATGITDTKVKNKWKLPFTEFVVTDKDEKYRLVWEWIGEGNSGDYDSCDPEDVPFLRANLELWEDGEKGEEGDDLSYCTLAPTNTPKSELLRMACELFSYLHEGRTPRGVMERWTHETRPRKFRRSLVEVEVLSEGDEHLEFDDLSDLHEKITNEHYSGQFGITTTELVDADRMSALLSEQGSSPEFFDIEKIEE